MKPRKNEHREDFLTRFMRKMKEEYPNQAYRYIVAIGVWEEHRLNEKNNLRTVSNT